MTPASRLLSLVAAAAFAFAPAAALPQAYPSKPMKILDKPRRGQIQINRVRPAIARITFK